MCRYIDAYMYVCVNIRTHEDIYTYMYIYIICTYADHIYIYISLRMIFCRCIFLWRAGRGGSFLSQASPCAASVEGLQPLHLAVSSGREDGAGPGRGGPGADSAMTRRGPRRRGPVASAQDLVALLLASRADAAARLPSGQMPKAEPQREVSFVLLCTFSISSPTSLGPGRSSRASEDGF